MPCCEIKEHLLDYLDNELPATLHDEVEQHLRTCLDCRTELESYRTTTLLLQLRAVPEPSAGYWDQTWEKIRRRTQARVFPLHAAPHLPVPRWQRLLQTAWRPLLLTAAGFLLAALGVTTWQQHQREHQPPQWWSEQHRPLARELTLHPVSHAIHDEDMPAELRRQIELMNLSRGTMGAMDPISKSTMMLTLEGTPR
ncbi:MAG: anti-sigma factor [candidate division KSB1 bacterium]|nr:anti-sigma factor [candidate division KSB1 bacterium]MDZ7272869.1 anti-sigma factor [candidate division KSB1 bacterium]MDZ7284108.1 anti-sigma factor [candidate division KSB1 bacterium]MDZ7297494.1 anti-sigma factor [candidate division KSB1 bacterium]MDZ7305630.1 anti-sigma factor [candidate division KSB1 bacterium]